MFNKAIRTICLHKPWMVSNTQGRNRHNRHTERTMEEKFEIRSFAKCGGGVLTELTEKRYCTPTNRQAFLEWTEQAPSVDSAYRNTREQEEEKKISSKRKEFSKNRKTRRGALFNSFTLSKRMSCPKQTNSILYSLKKKARIEGEKKTLRAKRPDRLQYEADNNSGTLVEPINRVWRIVSERMIDRLCENSMHVRNNNSPVVGRRIFLIKKEGEGFEAFWLQK